MPERKKLELEVNKPAVLELLFDEPMIGNSRFGEYYLYAVKNGSNTEYSFFAPEEVHKEIKNLRKGERFQVSKLAEQNGKKIITKYEVKLPEKEKIKQPTSEPDSNSSKDNYFEAMLTSYQDAMKIQEKLNGMVDVTRIAISLFIARSKLNGNGI